MTTQKNINFPEELLKNSNHPELILDAKFKEFLDSITDLTSRMCFAPISLITFVNQETIWVQSQVGLPKVQMMQNNGRFCGVFTDNNEYLEISDTDIDTIHQAHRFSINGEKARFYAGAKINLPYGEKMYGVLSVFDMMPRTLIEIQREYLLGMAKVIAKSIAAKNFINRVV